MKNVRMYYKMFHSHIRRQLKNGASRQHWLTVAPNCQTAEQLIAYRAAQIAIANT